MGDGSAAETTRGASIEVGARSLRQGTGVLVVGERGAGRSYFVECLLEELDDATRGRVWIGDDVDRFSEDRLTGLREAVLRGSLLPVMTAAAGGRYADAVERLVRAGAVIRIDLEPMSPSALLRAVENFLGGRLDAEAAPTYVPGRPGGDLVVLQEAVRAARARGALVERDGVWFLVNPTAPQEEIRRLIMFRLGIDGEAASGAAETVLDLVGLAPGISLEQVEALLDRLGVSDGGVHLERLERMRVLDVFETAGAVRLRVHDPVIELQLPQTLGVLRRRRLVDALIDVLGSSRSELTAGEVLALALHARARGRRVETSLLTQAARVALQSYRPELALQLGAAAQADGGGFDADLVVAIADSQAGRTQVALDAVSALGLRSDLEPEQRALLGRLRALIQDRIDDPHARWTTPVVPPTDSPPVDLPRWDAVLEFTRYPATSDASTVRTHDPTALVEGERLTTTASVEAMRGRLVSAHHALDRAEALLAPAGADLFLVEWTRVFVRAYDAPLGASVGAMVTARNRSAALGESLHQGMSSYLLGAFLLMGGRAKAAVPELQTALAIYERLGLESVALHARPVLAIALTLSGRPDEAETILSTEASPVPDPYLEGQCHEARGWLLVAAGREADAVDHFFAAAASHRSDGFLLESQICLVHAARAGGARRALPMIDELTQHIEGRCVAVFENHARVLARFESAAEQRASAEPEPRELDPLLAAELDGVAAEAALFGFHTLAAEASSRAWWLHERLGDDRSAAASARHCDEQVTATGLSTIPFLLGRDRVLLSRREREIAVSAASGATNREIADRLVLSVRTVETHLLRVYRKLGVRGRSQLAEALTVSELAGLTGFSEETHA